MNPMLMTNATKAQVMIAVNAGLQLLPLFGLLTDNNQMAGVAAFVNAVAAIFIGTTYRNSPTRVTDS
jgi:hypothetical protein